MQIKVYPIDLIKLCLWDSYVYYVVGSDKEAQKILEENNEMILSDRDALIIGLLKVIETDNLIHKFNTHIVEILSNKSTSVKKETGYQLLIRKRVLDSSVDKFLDKFPTYWDPSPQWKSAIDELTKYIDGIRDDISNLEVHTEVVQNMTVEYYSTNNVKKLLKFKY